MAGFVGARVGQYGCPGVAGRCGAICRDSALHESQRKAKPQTALKERNCKSLYGGGVVLSDLGAGVTDFEEFGEGSPIGLIAVTVAETMRAEGIEDLEADQIARKIAWSVTEKFGGQHWFVPLDGGVQKSDPPLILFIVDEVRKAIDGRLKNPIELALHCGQECRKKIGGAYMYVKRCGAAKRLARDQQIWRAFNGANFRALSNQFDLSEMRIRQIVQKERERRAQGRGK